MVAPVAPGQLLAGGPQLEGGALGQLGAEALRPELLHEVAHPSRAAVLPVAELAEELGDRPRQLDRLIRGDEDVDVARHPRPVGEAAADEQVEAEVAVVEARRPQADVVDLGLGAVVAAAGDAELELAGQVRRTRGCP